MALTQISTGGVKNDAVTAGKIPANAVGSSEIANDAVGQDQLADNAVVTANLTNDCVTDAKIADNAISEARLEISNAGTNGQFLSKQSGDTGGLTWADAITAIADDSITQAKIADDAIGQDQLADNAVVLANLTNDCVTADKIADEAIAESRLEISNAGTNGQYLQKQSGNTGGLTWASVSAAPQITGTVSGSIADQGAVIVKTDGNLEAVSKTVTEKSPITHSSTRSMYSSQYYHRVAYDALTGYTALATRNTSSSSRGQVTFHKFDGDKPDSGSNSGTVYTWQSSLVEALGMASNNKGAFLAAFKNGDGNRIATNVLKVSSDGVYSSGGSNNMSASGVAANNPEVVYIPNRDLFVCSYKRSDYYAQTITLGANNTGQTYGTVSNQIDSDGSGAHRLYYDEFSDKLIWVGWTSNYLRAVSGTISGTSITWNTGVNIAGTGSYSGEYVSIGGDPNTGLMLAAWMGASSQSDHGKVIGFKVNGNGFTAGSETTHRSNPTVAHCVSFSPSIDKIVLTYGSNGSPHILGTKSVVIDSSSLAVTFGTEETIHTSYSPASNSINMAYDSAETQHVVTSANSTETELYGVDYGSFSTNLTAENFIGFADSAYSNGNTGTVNVVGNTSTKSGLTAGKKHYVQINGGLSTTADSPSVEAGIALSSTKLLIK